MIASACLAWLAIGLVVFATDLHESDEPLTPRGVTDDLVVYCVLGPIICVVFIAASVWQWARRIA